MLNANLDYLSAEIILESKGDGFVLKDKWKEELILKELNNKVFNTYKSPTETANINIYALPFFISKATRTLKKNLITFLVIIKIIASPCASYYFLLWRQNSQNIFNFCYNSQTKNILNAKNVSAKRIIQ